MLWSRCPKTKFCGRARVVLAVSETVCHFNNGAGSTLTLMEALDVEPSSNMLSALRHEDINRVKEAARKVSEKTRLLRRKKRGQRKSKSANETVSYLPGAFGVEKQPEAYAVGTQINTVTKYGLKRKRITDKEGARNQKKMTVI